MNDKKESELKELDNFFAKAELLTEPENPDLHSPDIDLFLDGYLSIGTEEKPSVGPSNRAFKNRNNRITNG